MPFLGRSPILERVSPLSATQNSCTEPSAASGVTGGQRRHRLAAELGHQWRTGSLSSLNAPSGPKLA